jgi:hypothetical protein
MIFELGARLCHFDSEQTKTPRRMGFGHGRSWPCPKGA